MNRAQKNAWFGLVNCLLAIAFCCFFFFRVMFFIPTPSFRFAPQPSQTEIIIRVILQFWPLAFPVIALILLLLPRKKQSPAEPDFDELDSTIQNETVRISFISVWFLWPLALVITMLKFGITKPIPTIFFFYIHFGVFLVCMAIYFLTKLLLYRKQTEGGAV